MKNNPKVFISYSHEDKEFASDLAEKLLRNGVDVWIDKYEIQPGDSLIQKIFEEGLSNSDFFLILLSKNSSKSKWVKEELDAAIIKKMEGVTRVIPIIVEPTDIPLPLKSLLWIDMSSDIENGSRTLLKTLHGVSQKPPMGKPPEFVAELKNSVGGLSKNASTVGWLLIRRPSDQTGFEKAYSGQQINSELSFLTIEELNDSIEELEDYGLVKTFKAIGTVPYTFYQVTPTYALFLLFKDELDYDPEEDIKSVASAVSEKKQIDGKGLQSILYVPPVRLNRAVAYLEDYGYVKIFNFIGTAPYNFGLVKATRQTRKFVQENCK